MTLLVLCYPEMSAADYGRIQAFRQQHDGLYYHVIGPHVTLVFPTFDWEAEPFVAETAKQLRGFRPFDFCLRCAVLNKDAFNNYYHTLLVPDEGYSQVVKLHDRLYADKLFPHRALQVDFIPHIGIGNSKNPNTCLQMIDSWNKDEFSIWGRIVALDVVRYEDDTVQTIQRLALV